MLNRLYKEMICFYAGSPAFIQHFVKVHSFARLIGQEEKLDEKMQLILEAAAYVHDIGIKPSLELYGNAAGPNQEALGPELAEKMMNEIGFEKEVVERVCYLVGHHHTYTNIDGLDYQILVEADFLVNYYESEMSPENIEASINKIFKTKCGKEIAETMFGR